MLMKPTEDQEELVHADDTVIGRAFRRSILAILIAAVVGGGIWYFRRPKPAARRTQVTPLNAPVNPTRSVPEVPRAIFTEVTANAGIKFVHQNGAEGDKLLPETMGGGGAFFDFDNDGDQDLLLINGADWPWAKKKTNPTPTAALYRNDGQGRFEDITAGSGLDVSIYGMGAAVGDFD